MEVAVFDIETWPMPGGLALPEFEFDESGVKVGDIQRRNLSPEEKEEMISAKVEAAKAAAFASHSEKIAALESSKTLYAENSRVFAWIVQTGDDEFVCAHEPDPGDAAEAKILGQFWNVMARHKRWAGWNALHFDLPFLYMRSLLLGVQPPFALVDMPRYSGNTFIGFDPLQKVSSVYYVYDLMDEFGKLSPRSKKLNHAASVFGLGEKHDLGEGVLPWQAPVEEQQKYLIQDGRLTWQLAQRLLNKQQISAPNEIHS